MYDLTLALMIMRLIFDCFILVIVRTACITVML
jgi:hypothetical protein